jgi:predicted RNase H-like HicB family nuclease
MDDGWYVGKLKEVPGVFSQGETLHELQENIQDAYDLVLEDSQTDSIDGTKEQELMLEV